MRITFSWTRKPVSILLLFLLLAHLLMLALLLLMGISVSSTPSAVAQSQIFSYTDISARVLRTSPCHGVAPGQTRSWQPLFIIVLMGAPSATSVHTFAFLRCCLDNNFILQKEDFYARDESVVSYAGKSRKLRSLLSPLIERASNFVPKRFRKFTPILFRATSKLRTLIPQKDAHRLLFRTRSILRHSPFDYKSEYVTIMEDTEEAADLWLSAAFLTGRLYTSSSSPLAVIDLTGGTLKVAIPVVVESKFNNNLESKKVLINLREKKRNKRLGRIENDSSFKMLINSDENLGTDKGLHTKGLVNERTNKSKENRRRHRSRMHSNLIYQSEKELELKTDNDNRTFRGDNSFYNYSDVHIKRTFNDRAPLLDAAKFNRNLNDSKNPSLFVRKVIYNQLVNENNNNSQKQKFRLSSSRILGITSINVNSYNKTVYQANNKNVEERTVNSSYLADLLSKNIFGMKESDRLQSSPFKNGLIGNKNKRQGHSKSKFKRKRKRKKRRKIFKRSDVDLVPKITLAMISSKDLSGINIIHKKSLIKTFTVTTDLENNFSESNSTQILSNNISEVYNNTTTNINNILPRADHYLFHIHGKLENKMSFPSDENSKFKVHHTNTPSQGRNMHRKLERSRRRKLSFPVGRTLESKNENQKKNSHLNSKDKVDIGEQNEACHSTKAKLPSSDCHKNIENSLWNGTENGRAESYHHVQVKNSISNPLTKKQISSKSIHSNKSLEEPIASDRPENAAINLNVFGNLVTKRRRKRISKVVRRRRREVEHLRLLSNVTYRCASGGKLWLFATSIPLGIYPARVNVLLGKKLFVSKNRSSFHLTPSSNNPPIPAVTSWSRSDIRPEEEYNLPSNGSFYVIPSPPPVPSSFPLPEPSGPGPPSILSYPNSVLPISSNISSVSNKTKDIYSYGSLASNYSSGMDGLPDMEIWNVSQGTLDALDHEIKMLSPTSTVDPLWTQDTLEKVKNVVDSVLRAIGTIQKADKQNTKHENNKNIEVEENMKTGKKRKHKIKRLKQHKEQRKHKNISLDKKRKHKNSKLIGKSTKLKNNEFKANISFNNKKPSRTNPANKTVILASNKLVEKTPNKGFNNSISSKPVRRILPTRKSGTGLTYNITSVNKRKQTSFFPNKFGTISSVTDLLFTVPNLRVINPKENSKVDSEIKSTEKLVRTSLTDLLYSVPDRSLSNDTNGKQQSISEKAIKHLTFPILGLREKSSQLEPSENRDWMVPLTKPLDELVIESSCIPLGSTGRFTINDVSYIVKGTNVTNRKEKCWAEVTKVVEKYVQVPSVDGMDILASTAFYFVADSANLIGPNATYGYVKPLQFKQAADDMCIRPPNRLPDPLACLDYQFAAALLLHGFCLPQDEDIMVSDSISDFRLSSALGAALNFLQKH